MDTLRLVTMHLSELNLNQLTGIRERYLTLFSEPDRERICRRTDYLESERARLLIAYQESEQNLRGYELEYAQKSGHEFRGNALSYTATHVRERRRLSFEGWYRNLTTGNSQRHTDGPPDRNIGQGWRVIPKGSY